MTLFLINKRLMNKYFWPNPKQSELGNHRNESVGQLILKSRTQFQQVVTCFVAVTMGCLCFHL